MMRAAWEVAQVLNRNACKLGTYCANSWQERTLHALRKCRTAELGGHIDRCDNPGCNHLHLSYNSCRNRHCPKCQGHQREQWIRAREAELLRVPYFHLVFTLPDPLNGLCLYAPREVYTILFKTAWSVIRDFAANPKFMGGQAGMIAILHSWGQNLSLHPHLHCIVPGGGMSSSGKWTYANGKGKYLFPVKEMSKVFRARFVEQLRKGFELPASLYKPLFKKPWIVYCKRPFFGPSQGIEYMGRYTHRIAISNHRLIALNQGEVTFMAKDYRKGGRKYSITLSDSTFIRRFVMHILPKGFVRIRHYGILSSSSKKRKLKQLQDELGVPQTGQDPEPLHHNRCPVCKKGKLLTIATFDNRGPPTHWSEKLRKSGKQQPLQTVSRL